MSGWVDIDRDLFSDPLFPKEPMSEREAFIWLKANAAWQDTQHRVGSEMVHCPRGSIFITLREFQTTTSWGSDTKIRNFLLRLENAGLIKRTVHGRRNARKTQVTICNYGENTDGEREENAPKTHRERTKNAVKEQGNNKQTSEAKASSGGVVHAANDLAHAVTRFNAVADVAGWPKVAKMNSDRSRKLKARLKECGGIEGWEVALKKAFDSDFVRSRWAGFGFDALISPGKFTKLMEGNYDNRDSKPQLADRQENRADPALEQIARLAGLGETPRDGGAGTRSNGEEDGPVRMGAGPGFDGTRPDGHGLDGRFAGIPAFGGASGLPEVG